MLQFVAVNPRLLQFALQYLRRRTRTISLANYSLKLSFTSKHARWHSQTLAQSHYLSSQFHQAYCGIASTAKTL